MIELISGSIFDKKCDIIIVPCNIYGEVSDTVFMHLETNKIPFSPKPIQEGDIYFSDENKDFLNAQIIGFASSVNPHKLSTVQNVNNICRQIKEYCMANYTGTIPIVNIPLLGSGAGGLSYEDSFKILISNFKQEQGLNVRVFAYSQDAFIQLKDIPLTSAPVKNPRVFISYTRTDENNVKWVKKLAYRLRENGVDARIDLFHLKPGQFLPQWMTDEIFKADKVLLICDKFYVQKADMRKGGVGWETMIIQGDMLTHSQTEKYICISREKDADKSLPMFAHSSYALHWSSEEIPESDFKDLLYALFDCNIEPPLNDIPEFILSKLHI